MRIFAILFSLCIAGAFAGECSTRHGSCTLTSCNKNLCKHPSIVCHVAKVLPGKCCLPCDQIDWPSTSGKSDQCGLSPVSRSIERIVGGHYSRSNAWPWNIEITSFGNHNCGGVIWNRNYVITAGHCIGSLNARDLTVVVGQTDRQKSFESHRKFYGVTKVIVHPKFDQHAKYVENDIAVLRLDKPIYFDSYTMPACYADYDFNYDLAHCVSVGWGSSYQGGPASTKLQEADTPVLSNSKCLAKFKTKVNKYKNVCAGNTGGHKGICGGDSGSPLMCYRHGHWFLSGIASFGADNCGDGAAYTRISGFKDWIDTLTKY
ncbi:hypothetical protein SNEBB_000443 [Seison nebaliae]|nr:hypothetical protein SNEBB_000443 [Seison nebaliae]